MSGVITPDKITIIAAPGRKHFLTPVHHKLEWRFGSVFALTNLS